jgi:integral membrane sensor domain MASE1
VTVLITVDGGGHFPDELDVDVVFVVGGQFGPCSSNAAALAALLLVVFEYCARDNPTKAATANSFLLKIISASRSRKSLKTIEPTTLQK